MSKDELMNLSKEKFYVAAEARINNKIYNDPDDESDIIESVKGLSVPSRALFVGFNFNYYLEDIDTFGLFDYLEDEGENLAQFLPFALEEIGAKPHKKLIEDFFYKNGFKFNDMSAFSKEIEKEGEKLKKKYPFRDFDIEYDKLKPLSTYLVEYAKLHIDEL